MKQTEGSQEFDISKTTEVPLPVKDLPRIPIEIRAANDSEFVGYSEEQMRKGAEALGRIIGGTRYNSLVLATALISAYEEREDSNATLLDVFKGIKLGPNINSQEVGATCIGMAEQMKMSLQELGVHSYLVRYKARGLANNAGDEYVGVSHTAAIVPSIENGEQAFTIFDSGLLIPVPIRFISGEDSPKFYFRNKYCQVTCGSDDFAYPYTLVIAEAEKSAIMAGSSNPVYKVTDAAPFDPYHEYLNPYDTLAKDYLRATQGFRITRQNSQGENVGYVAVDLLQQAVKLKFAGLEYQGKRGKVGIPFGKINIGLRDTAEMQLIATVTESLGVPPDYIFDSLDKLIRYRDVYISDIYAPSVREAYRKIQ